MSASLARNNWQYINFEYQFNPFQYAYSTYTSSLDLTSHQGIDAPPYMIKDPTCFAKQPCDGSPELNGNVPAKSYASATLGTAAIVTPTVTKVLESQCLHTIPRDLLHPVLSLPLNYATIPSLVSRTYTLASTPLNAFVNALAPIRTKVAGQQTEDLKLLSHDPKHQKRGDFGSNRPHETLGADLATSRTLPKLSSLITNGAAPGARSMMGQFNSKELLGIQKKHRCQVCEKRFVRPSALKIHIYSHTGEKPFSCDVGECGRQFSVVSNLRRHRRAHKEQGVVGHSERRSDK